MVHAAQPLHAEPLPAALRIQLQRQLRLELGEQAELVSLRADGQRRLRGLAICSGRLLSFVLDAEAQRLRTRPLLHLLRLSSAPVEPS